MEQSSFDIPSDKSNRDHANFMPNPKTAYFEHWNTTVACFSVLSEQSQHNECLSLQTLSKQIFSSQFQVRRIHPAPTAQPLLQLQIRTAARTGETIENCPTVPTSADFPRAPCSIPITAFPANNSKQQLCPTPTALGVTVTASETITSLATMATPRG